MNKQIKAVIFDLDGTLLDTLYDLTDAVNFALNKNGLKKRSIDEVRQFVGNGIVNLIVRARPQGKATDTLADIAADERALGEHEKLLADFKSYYNEHCEDNTKPYDGIIPLLERLKENNIKIAVVSNKADFAVKKLVPAYFGDLVDVACGEDEAHGIGKKPAPEMVYRVLDELDTTAAEAIYVGDSDVDIATAKNSNMDCISVLWGFRDKEFLKENGASMFAESPDEILRIIKTG